MSAIVIPVFEHEHNLLNVARQEYALAKANFKHVCTTMDCHDPEAIARFQEVSRLRQEAFEQYMTALSAD